MTAALGYNPLRLDCAAQGCFNLKRRSNIELFADCFPGRISFGDVDGIVEIGGIRYPPNGYEPADLARIKRRLTAWSEWAMRQGWGGKPVRVEQAQGIPVAALGVLARLYGYWRSR
jgi:hypothetical protein